ncbi:hypothetical protein GDO81_016603 [Engystomops pustulosus]|uniref:Uncharacterized protein n=1 Tax=Engystomops pustulosus TaxID=76066 RepID=A0AAV7ATB0_ENGPU|nr:hypothetical protein GDO81_016603 [Engystomops pustulosus]KAG8564799.1 hypothetical protein GDO81_016603 [Engystomops pustulosus]
MSQASLQEPPALRQLDKTIREEIEQFTSSSENSLGSKKNKVQKKETKHPKMCDTLQLEDVNRSRCYMEEQDSSKKKKLERNRASKESNENHPPQEVTHPENIPPLGSPVMLKKSKKKKQQLPPDVQLSANSTSKIEPLRPTPENIGSWKTRKSRILETTTDQKDEKTSKNDDGIPQRIKKHPLSLHQQNKVTFLCSTPLSSPAASLKTKKKTKLNGPGKNDEFNGFSDHSQDLFITQRKFVSSHVSSGDSPPLGQEQFLSQLSCRDRYSSGSNHQVVLKETSTQTDHDLSFLSLMSLVKKVKVLVPCSEKPLDLSLPSRIRAKRKVRNYSNEVIVIPSQSPPMGQEASSKSSLKFNFSPIPKFDETKFIQTVLNSSYFFKGKGEPGEATPITPLIKGSERAKKRPKKSGVTPKKRLKQHH